MNDYFANQSCKLVQLSLLVNKYKSNNISVYKKLRVCQQEVNFLYTES